MLNIDKKIFTIDQVICRHLAEANNSNRGMISQDVLSHLRNFVEHLMLKCYADRNDIDNTYENICKAIKYVAKQGKLKVLSRFHDYLQIFRKNQCADCSFIGIYRKRVRTLRSVLSFLPCNAGSCVFF